jgi:hypothetical protein
MHNRLRLVHSTTSTKTSAPSLKHSKSLSKTNLVAPSFADQLQQLANTHPRVFRAVRAYVAAKLAEGGGDEVGINSPVEAEKEPAWGWPSPRHLVTFFTLAGLIA